MSTPSVKLQLLALLLFSLLAGCARCTLTGPNTPAGPRKANTAPEPLTTATERIEFHTMATAMAEARQQPAEAARQTLALLRDEPSAKLAAQATRLALQAGDEPLALKAARQWLKLEPANTGIRYVILRLAVRQDQKALALTQCRKLLSAGHTDRSAIYDRIVVFMSEDSRHAKTAWAVMQKLLANDEHYAPAHTAAGLLALRLDQPKQAERQARQALKLDPHSTTVTLLLVSALIHQNRLTKADHTIDGLLRRADIQHPQALRLDYVRMLLQSHHNAHARGQLLELLGLHPHNVDALMQLAVMDINSRQYQAAQKILHGIPRHNAATKDDVQYYLGRIAEARNQPKAAIAHYRRVQKGNRVVDATIHRALLIGRIGNFEDGLDLLAQAATDHPQQSARIVAASSQLLVNADHPHSAIVMLDHFLKSNPDNTDLLYARAMVYNHLKQTDRAETDLRRILAQAPDNADALNALGYMLTLHAPKQLKQAHAMIARALRQDPDDPAVMDSMGWVLYRQGQARKALPLLQKAYALSHDAEIAAHLVAVLDALGKTAQARGVLAQALQDHPDNAALQKVAAKLKAQSTP